MLDARLGGHDHRLVHLSSSHAVVQVAHRLIEEIVGLTLVLHPAAGAVDVALQAAGIEHLLFAVWQGDEHSLLRLAIHRAVTPNGACLATFLTVNNVTPRRPAETQLHELVLHRVLNALDLQWLAVHRTTETPFHHRLSQAPGIGLHRIRRRFIHGQLGVRL